MGLAGQTNFYPCPLFHLQYISKLMEWIEKQINNEDVFPSEVGESPQRPLPN